VRILLMTSPDHVRRPGGDAIVVESLRDCLRVLGHRVDLSGEPLPDLAGYDAVHLFNLESMPRTFLQAERTRLAGRPYLLTPFYWTPEEAIPWQGCVRPQSILRKLLPERCIDALALATVCGARRRGLGALARLPSLSRQRLRESVLAGAWRVLASCRSERDRLLRDFPGIPPERVAVARLVLPSPSPAQATVPLPEPGYFLCVGAFGPRKNQLGLARALRKTPGARIVFIGSAAPGDQGYLRAVRGEAPPGSLFLPDQPHGALPEFYAGAQAVVQVSFIELPGLVAMEAVANRRPVVVADRPPVREYLDGLALFANPFSGRSIREACLAARPPDEAEASRFVTAHRWDRLTPPIEEAYRTLETELRQRP
jgi:glycosyltransferase involved in cell wall biosynthesis